MVSAPFFCHPNTPSCHPSAQTLGSRKLNSTPSKCTIRTRSQCQLLG
ncbi:hypothetical protein [Wolbachia endosymbiont (group A) of Agelastica alni]